MLRKSPYTEENYNYITSMMDNMRLQESLRNPIYNNNTMDDLNPNNNTSLFTNNMIQNANSNLMFNVRDIDTKKQVQSESSVYGKEK